MSDEPASKVEKYVADKGINYPTAAGATDASARAFGVGAYPSAYLIDHEGTVLWVGNFPDKIPASLLEQAIAAAESDSPNWDPGERHEVLSKAVSAAKDGQMGRAWKASESARKKAGEDAAAISAIDTFQADLRQRGDGRLVKAQAMADEGRLFQAVNYLEEQGKVYSGSPLAREWKDTMKAWMKDKGLKAQYDLDKKRVSALEKAQEGDFSKAIKDLQKLIDKAGSLPIVERLRSDYEALRSVA